MGTHGDASVRGHYESRIARLRSQDESLDAISGTWRQSQRVGHVQHQKTAAVRLQRMLSITHGAHRVSVIHERRETSPCRAGYLAWVLSKPAHLSDIFSGTWTDLPLI